MAGQEGSLFVRHEFLIRRLHSLTGLIPVGAYMVIHLLTNAMVLNSPAAYQQSVYSIHGLGRLLTLVEWVFIFIPILFHGIVGLLILRGVVPNSGQYPYVRNIRYTWQRVTGIIAFAFIGWHVFHMHGWFHNAWWIESVVQPLGGHRFRPFNAASSAALALQGSLWVAILYAVGILACVYHLANGLWTMGITWGIWISPAAQRRADYVCMTFGVLLAAVGLGALWGMRTLDIPAARQVEDLQYQYRVEAGELMPNQEKRSTGPSPVEGTGRQQAQADVP